MKKLILLTFLIVVVFLQLNLYSYSTDSPVFIDQNVNVITGEYTETNLDHQSSGAYPIELVRSFNIDSKPGWRFNHPNVLTREETDPMRTKDLGLAVVSYEYGPEMQLQLIKTANKEGSVIYNWMRFNHSESKDLTKRYSEIETSDGQIFKYEFSKNDKARNDQGFLLNKVIMPNGSEIFYTYRNHPNERKKLLAKKEESGQRFIINEYYQGGHNIVGGTLVSIVDLVRDFRIGRVKLQKAPIGTDNSELISKRFFYEENVTHVYDALNNRKSYYHKNGLVTSIESYEGDANAGGATPVRKERFFWNRDKRLTCRTVEDGQGVIYNCKTYGYDKEGNLIHECLYGNISGVNNTPIVIKDDLVVENGTEKYSLTYEYNDKKQLIRTSESNGLTIRYLYHPENGLLLAKLTGSPSTILMRQFFEYDAKGLVTFTCIDDGSSEDKEKTSDISERKYIRYTYGSGNILYGLPVAVEEGYIDPETGEALSLKKTINSYSEKGKLVHQQVCTQAGDQWSGSSFEYDHCGRRVGFTDAEGKIIHSSFDINGNLIAKKEIGSEEISETSYSYDFCNRLIRSETITNLRDLPIVESYKYDLAGHKISSSDEFGNETLFAYDGLGRLIETILPEVMETQGQVVRPTARLRYDCCNRVCESIDPKGYITKTSYNARDKPALIEYPDGTSEAFEYYLDGTLKRHKKKNGVETVYERDLLGRPVKTETLNSVETQKYNTFHAISSTDKDGFTTHLTYDKAGRVEECLQETSEGTSKSSFSYDCFGQVSSIKKAAGNSGEQIVQYDNVKDSQGKIIETVILDSNGNRLLSKKEPEKPKKAKTTYSITANSLGQNVLQTKTADAAGVLTIVIYDALKRPHIIIKENSYGAQLCKTVYSYDLCNNKCKEEILDPNGESKFTILQEYGPCNRLETITEAWGTPLQQTIGYVYNSKGFLEKIIKADGVSLHYRYTEQGQVGELSSSDGSVHYVYTYDGKGNLIGIADLVHGDEIHRKYNSRNMLTSESLGPFEIKKAYDILGRVVGLTLPDQSSISYEYDAYFLREIKRLSKDKELLYVHSNKEYSPEGLLTLAKCIGHAGEKKITYGEQQKIEAIETPYWSEKITSAKEKWIETIQFQDPLNSYSQTYLYDEQHRLLAESGLHSNTFDYDVCHNRISANGETIEHNRMNQPVSNGKEEYCYDPNGNLIERKTALGTIRYKYDALNRLTEVVKGGQKVSYRYDGLHRRIAKHYHNEDCTVYYLYDEEKEIGLADRNGAIVQLRVLEPTYMSEIGAAVAIELEGKAYAPICDHIGSIRCLIDPQDKSAAEFYRFSAFGEEEIYDENGEKKENALNPWRYSSKRFDEETGFLYFGRRYYLPESGRWITKDPLGHVDGMNRYAFVQNNPISNVDHFGLLTWESFFGSLSGTYHCFLGGLNDFLGLLHQHLSYSSYVNDEIDFILENTVGKGFLQFSGYYINPMETGVYGCGELSEKIRITLLNGIGCIRSDFAKSVSIFSRAHGHENIHYIFRPTRGWSHDMLMGFLVKCGYVSPHARNLANTWKKLIQEMGGVDGGGLIIHYAHSMGGTDTYVAAGLLTPEEKKMIRVITLGSSTMIPSDGFESVVNYVSKKDLVPISDPVGYFNGLFSEDSNMRFYGSFFAMPILEHALLSETYCHVIHAMGQQFLAMIPLL